MRRRSFRCKTARRGKGDLRRFALSARRRRVTNKATFRRRGEKLRRKKNGKKPCRLAEGRFFERRFVERGFVEGRWREERFVEGRTGKSCLIEGGLERRCDRASARGACTARYGTARGERGIKRRGRFGSARWKRTETEPLFRRLGVRKGVLCRSFLADKNRGERLPRQL